MEDIFEQYGELIIGVIIGGGLLATMAAMFLLPNSPFYYLVERFISNL